MTNELLLLRHGKSDWATSTDDFSRPLKKRGIQAAQKQGGELKRLGLIPELVLCSPATRAKATAFECCTAMGEPEIMIKYEQRIYMADAESLLRVLSEASPTVSRILLVGHNPGMAALLDYLVASPIPESDDGEKMPTATLAHFSVPVDWQQLQRGCATLVQLLRP